MHKRSVLVLAILTIFAGLFITACDGQVAERPDQASGSGAQQVEDIFQVPKNSQGRTTEQ